MGQQTPAKQLGPKPEVIPSLRTRGVVPVPPDQHIWLIHPKKGCIVGLLYSPKSPEGVAPGTFLKLLHRARPSQRAPEPHRGRFALVVAGVLLQDVQGLGLGAGFTADTGAGSGLVAVIAPRCLAPIRGEGIAGGKVRSWGERKQSGHGDTVGLLHRSQ